MDFSIPAAVADLHQRVRDFVEQKLMAADEAADPSVGPEPAVLRALREEAVRRGIYAYNLPADIGGGGVGSLGLALVSEEVGRTSIPVGDTVGRLPGWLTACRDEQRRWLLEPALRGELILCGALTEPEAGSDLTAARTAAERIPGGWRLNGVKEHIVNADISDYILVLAVTDPDRPPSTRFTAFLVHRDNPGLRLARHPGQLGWHGARLTRFALEDCVVPEDHVLGDIGGGFPLMMGAVNVSRVYVAARCVGTARECLRRAVSYAGERQAFGVSLSEHQAIQFQLADMDVELEAARLLVLAAAAAGERDDPGFRIAASRAKLYATEMAGRVADAALQIFGASGFLSSQPIERMYRDVRGFRISDGTSEIQRIQIARHLLRRR